MKVKIKNLGSDVDVRTKGVKFRVGDNNDGLKGNFYVTGAKLIWCQGKTTKKNGVKVSWKDFIDWMGES